MKKFLKKFKIVNSFYEIYIGISEFLFKILSKVVSFFSNSKIVRRLVFNLLPINKDFYLDTIYGNFILNTNSRIISKKSYYSKTPYSSKSLIKVFKILEKENIDIDIFVDVGANVGTTSIASAYLNSNLDVLCIEGNSSNYSYLVKNIKLNNLENKVTAINSLVGESDNQRYFVEFVEEKGCSKVFNDLDELKRYQKKYKFNIKDSNLVTTVSLVSLLKNNLDKNLFIWLDLEGIDLEIIYGRLTEYLFPIYFEFNPSFYKFKYKNLDKYISKVEQYIIDCGYSFYYAEGFSFEKKEITPGFLNQITKKIGLNKGSENILII